MLPDMFHFSQTVKLETCSIVANSLHSVPFNVYKYISNSSKSGNMLNPTTVNYVYER